MIDSPKPNRSWGCCLLKVFGVMLLLLIVVALICVPSVRWFTNATQATPATYPPLITSPGEREDIDRVIQQIQFAQINKSIFDESITPNVFNGVVEAIIKGEKEKGAPVELDPLRLEFQGDQVHVRTTKTIKDGSGSLKYGNVQASFQLEVERGKIKTIHAQSVKMGDATAPVIAREFINAQMQQYKKLVNTPGTAESVHFRSINLIKREGDRIHIILDGSKFQTEDAGIPGLHPQPAKKPGTDDF